MAAVQPTPAAAPPLLACRGLAFARNDEPVFGPLGFALAPGQALQVLGGNGRGKTTLLRVLAGLLPASAGEVAFEGRVVDRDHLGPRLRLPRPPARAQGRAVHPGEPALRARLQGGAGDAEQALAEVGLGGHEDTLARRLSAGQNKRLALARLRLSPARPVAARRALRQPRPGRHRAGQSTGRRHVAARGSVLLTTHGAYAAPPVPVQTLELGA
jgi:heme exporter protein A